MLGGIAMAYNEPCLGNHVQLTGTQIAQIYSGKITDWNTIDSSCPAGSNIEPVYRADSSGTSNAFTHYMTSVDPADWPASLDGKQPAFPKGEGGNGNAGVAGDVAGRRGHHRLRRAGLRPAVGPELRRRPELLGAVRGARTGLGGRGRRLLPRRHADNYLIVNGTGAGAYPISTYSWVIVYQKQSNTNNGIALGKMLHWMATAGQSDAAAIGYVPLPANIQALATSTIMQMQNSSGAAPLLLGARAEQTKEATSPTPRATA